MYHWKGQIDKFEWRCFRIELATYIYPIQEVKGESLLWIAINNICMCEPEIDLFIP